MNAAQLLGLGAAYLFPFAIGSAILSLLERRERLFGSVERAALAFALGVGTVGFYLFYLGIARIPFSFITVTAIGWPFILIAPFRFFRRKRPRTAPFRLRFPSGFTKAQKAAAALIVLLLAAKFSFALFHAVFTPTYFDDSVANYNFKPQVFYHTGSIVPDPDSPWFMGGYRPAYPQGIPLFKVWVTTWTGGWSDAAANLLSPLIWLCLGIVAGKTFREFLPVFPALVFVYFLLSSPLLAFHAGFAYLDIVCAFFLFAGIALLNRWFRGRKRGLLLAAGLVLAVGLSVKDEMLALVLAGVLPPFALFQLLRRPRAREWATEAALFLGAIFVVNIPWFATKAALGLALGPRPDERAIQFHPEAFGYLSRYLFHTANYNIIWPVLIAAGVCALPRILKTPARYPALSLAGALAITLGLFIFTPFFEFLKIGTTINRAMLIILPLAVYYLALAYASTRRFGEIISPRRRGGGEIKEF